MCRARAVINLIVAIVKQQQCTRVNGVCVSNAIYSIGVFSWWIRFPTPCYHPICLLFFYHVEFARWFFHARSFSYAYVDDVQHGCWKTYLRGTSRHGIFLRTHWPWVLNMSHGRQLWMCIVTGRISKMRFPTPRATSERSALNFRNKIEYRRMLGEIMTKIWWAEHYKPGCVTSAGNFQNMLRNNGEILVANMWELDLAYGALGKKQCAIVWETKKMAKLNMRQPNEKWQCAIKHAFIWSIHSLTAVISIGFFNGRPLVARFVFQSVMEIFYQNYSIPSRHTIQFVSYKQSTWENLESHFSFSKKRKTIKCATVERRLIELLPGQFFSFDFQVRLRYRVVNFIYYNAENDTHEF